MKVKIEYEMAGPVQGYKMTKGSSIYTEFVVTTQDVGEMELVGGKAFNISQMAKKGIAVPQGFCITTKAYEYFMGFDGISKKDENVDDQIREAVMPPQLEEIIRDAYRRYLRGKPCAVRSSSPFEDLKRASFAGQYKSFLNVKDEKALIDAVKECWASLWSRPVVEYRKKMGIKEENMKMAVLVQEMIPAEASGVLFTEDDIVVEAVWGLGDILVGGKVIPDRFVIDRHQLTVVDKTISFKHKMSTVKKTGGVTITDTPQQLGTTAVLESDHIQELCALGKTVETVFGCPQDIEWALCDGEFVLLQTRPISVEPSTVYSRANIAETQPGYVTYLSRVPENKPDFFVLGALPLLEKFGIKDLPENVKFLEYIYGHIYANITNVHNIIGSIPALPPEVIDDAIGHADEGETSTPKLGFSTIVKMLPGTMRVIQFFLNIPHQAEEIIPRSLRYIKEIRHMNLEDMSLKELDELVWKIYDMNQGIFQVHASTMLANMSLFGVFQKFLEVIGEKDVENSLLMGLDGMSSCQLGVRVWNLAESASKSPKVAELICSRREDILEGLTEFCEGRAFKKELDTFMKEFGDRCSQEMELSVPRWEENPSFVLSMVANYLNAHPVDLIDTIKAQKTVRLEATNCILKNLSKNPLKKAIFQKILEKTQQYLAIRENLKTTWVRGISVMRVVYVVIAEKFVEKGILKERDDIFYLKMTEVSDIIAGNVTTWQVKDLIKERKKEKMLYENLDVPMIIIGNPPPIEELNHTVEPKAQLEGLGCSHGMVSGKARVVLDPNECPEFREGEILVAPVTDPGWTPLFVTAGALVMELGGTLSHGVIIAREYGIPAVVGVENATKIIKTGQLLTVDGNRGIVSIRE